MYSRVNYTIVGLFVLLFGIGMVAFSFWLAKYGLEQKYDLYKVYMHESVAGLSKDSVVKLHGVDIGRVKSIRIDPSDIERVEVVLEVKEGTPIKEDMVAHTTMLGVTGLLAIEIDGGTNGAKTLRADPQHIPVIPSEPSWFDRTKTQVVSLAERLNTLVAQTEKLLSDQNIQAVGKILAHTEMLSKKSISLVDEVNATVHAYRKAVGGFNRDLERMTDAFVRVSDESIPAIKKLKETSRNFNRVTLKVERTLDRGDYNIKKIMAPTLVDLEILSAQIGDLVRALEANPSDLLFKSRKSIHAPGE